MTSDVGLLARQKNKLAVSWRGDRDGLQEWCSPGIIVRQALPETAYVAMLRAQGILYDWLSDVKYLHGR